MVTQTHVSHSRLMTCLQLGSVPDPLRHAFLNASLDKNTSVEYSSVSLHIHKHTHIHTHSIIF